MYAIRSYYGTLTKLEEVAARIADAGGVCVPFDAIAGDAEQSRATVEKVIADWGRIDVLVNNAHTCLQVQR